MVPETCIDKVTTLHYSSLFAGHQGVMKTYLTISDKFFISNLIHYLRSYIKDCIPENIIVDQDRPSPQQVNQFIYA